MTIKDEESFFVHSPSLAPSADTHIAEQSSVLGILCHMWTTLDETLNISVETNTRECCTVSMPTDHARQPYGVVHGGINGVLIEHAGSLLALANAPDGKVAVGTELSVSHFAPNATGLARATATLVHLGRSSATSQVIVTDEHGTTTAAGQMTCVFVKR